MVEISEVVENIAGASLVSLLAFVILGLVWLQAWVFVFSATFSYVASDVIMNGIIHGGEGMSKIGWDNAFAEKGYAFIAFFGGMVLSTALLTWLLGTFLGTFNLLTLQSPFALIVALSAFDVMVILGDLEWRFYQS